MAKPKISVIIPVHDAGNYLEACLKSVLKQTLKGIQVICVDDGSTDNSFEILNNYKDDIIILQTDNKGASSARNKAFEIADGVYTAFLDADDSIPKDYLELLYREAKDKKADIVITGFNYIRGEASVKFNNPLLVGTYTEFSDKLKSLYNGALWNKLFRTSLLKKNKLTFEEGRMWEDNLFVIQALYYSKILSVIYKPRYNYEIHENSVTNSKDLRQKRIEDAKCIYRKAMDFTRLVNMNDDYVRQVDFFLRRKAMPNYVLD